MATKTSSKRSTPREELRREILDEVRDALHSDAHLYGEICDAVERVWLGLPGDSWMYDPMRHTSSESRAASVRILNLLADFLA